jgi:hypothetical protein
MQTEHRILVSASPEIIFDIYTDVANWRTWDPDTKASSLDGPFRIGTTGSLTPARGNTIPLVLTHVTPGHNFTVEARIPLLRMLFEHELFEVEGQTEVVHRASFHGLLAPLVGRVVGTRLNSGLPVTLANLKALAERRAQERG